jgi:hypothetical protein
LGSGGRLIGPATCENIAPTAVLEALSTAPGYSAAKVVDGSRDTGLGQEHSWTNDWRTPDIVLPQWLDFDFGQQRTIGRVELTTTEGYAVRNYDLMWWDGATWQLLVAVTDNTLLHRTHEFDLVSTDRLRILGRNGPSNQAGYIRLNEVEIYGASAKDCPAPVAGDTRTPPIMHPIPASEVSSQVTVTAQACIPDDPDYSCEFLDGEAYPQCSYQVLQGVRRFDSPPAVEYDDLRLWPGALLSRVERDASAFTVWQVDRSALEFTLTYASSRHQESATMDPASALTFQQALGSEINRRPGAPLPSVVRMDIDRIYDGEQFDVLTGLSNRIEGIYGTLLSYGFGEFAPQNIALVTLTFTYFTVEVTLPREVTALLAATPSTPLPAAPAMIQRVEYGSRLMLLARSPESFADLSSYLSRVVNRALAGAQAELSAAELLRFGQIKPIVMELAQTGPANVSPISTVENLIQQIGLRREFGTGRWGKPIAYRITDLDGQVLPRSVTARYVKPTCSAAP